MSDNAIIALILVLIANAFVGCFLLLYKSGTNTRTWYGMWKNGGFLGKLGIVLLAFSLFTPIAGALIAVGMAMYGIVCVGAYIENIYLSRKAVK